ncbi:MAG: hypothetical protein C5B49_05130, partial [Bdellovibrio sp.]
MSPAGRLYLEGDDLRNFNELREAFRRGNGHGLLSLDTFFTQTAEGPAEPPRAAKILTEPPREANLVKAPTGSFNYWQSFARRYLSFFSTVPDLDEHDFTRSSICVALSPYDLNQFLFNVPPMKGGEYVTRRRLLQLWSEIQAAIHVEIQESGKKVSEFLRGRFPHWSVSWGVCFHLTETAAASGRPFTFHVSYFNRFHHYPIVKALENYSTPEQEKYLIRLLTPIQQAAEKSSYLGQMIESAEILQTSHWTTDQTFQFVKEIPQYEEAGIVVKVPSNWREKHPSRPRLGLKIGEKPPQRVGLDALLDFASTVVLDDDELKDDDIQNLAKEFEASERLTYFKNRWVEVDQERLGRILEKSKLAAEKMADGLTFAQGLRMLAGVRRDDDKDTTVISGSWLEETLKKIREPGFYDRID